MQNQWRQALAKITNSIYHRIYLSGWSGWVMPRNIRKLIARSEIHRMWFLGYNGYFEEDGVAYGLARPYAAMLENRRGEFIEASEEYWEQVQILGGYDRGQELIRIDAETEINDALEVQNHFDQWNDYYEYTGMADLARESQRRENEMQGLDCEADTAGEFSKKSDDPMCTDDQTAKSVEAESGG